MRRCFWHLRGMRNIISFFCSFHSFFFLSFFISLLPLFPLLLAVTKRGILFLLLCTPLDVLSRSNSLSLSLRSYERPPRPFILFLVAGSFLWGASSLNNQTIQSELPNRWAPLGLLVELPDVSRVQRIDICPWSSRMPLLSLSLFLCSFFFFFFLVQQTNLNSEITLLNYTWSLWAI